MTTRILVAGSQPVLRDGIRAVLEQRGFCVAGSASCQEEAVELARRSLPDVAVLDAAFAPDEFGFAAGAGVGESEQAENDDGQSREEKEPVGRASPGDRVAHQKSAREAEKRDRT